MSDVKQLITRYSRDFDGNLQKDPDGSWVLAADAAMRDRKLMGKISALQLRLTAADERADSLESGIKWESDRNALLLASLTEGEDMLSITSLEAGQRIDQLEGLLFSLPEDLKALSGCENTPGVYACIDYIEQCIAGLQQVTAKQPLY